jgi:hypothetical protein
MLINRELANKEVATQFGVVKFNEKGESKDLKADQEKVLGELPGFEYEAERKAPAAKPATKQTASKAKTTDAKKN